MVAARSAVVNAVLAVVALLVATPVFAQSNTTVAPPPLTTSASGGSTAAPRSNSTTAANQTTNAPPTSIVTTSAPSGDSSSAAAQELWFIIIASLIGFVLVAAACYVTLMWQQHAIRNYKNEFEEIVKTVGLKKNQLAAQIKHKRKTGQHHGRRRNDADSAGEEAQAVVVRHAAEEDTHGALFGRMHASQLRSTINLSKAQEDVATQLDVQMRRKAREAAEKEREALLNAAGVKPLGRAVAEATSVEHAITTLEQRGQWRSLRSLDLTMPTAGRGGAPSTSTAARDSSLLSDPHRSHGRALNPADHSSFRSAGGASSWASGSQNPNAHRSRASDPFRSELGSDMGASFASPGKYTARSVSTAPSVLEL